MIRQDILDLFRLKPGKKSARKLSTSTSKQLMSREGTASITRESVQSAAQ
jgi:hypothetical protein